MKADNIRDRLYRLKDDNMVTIQIIDDVLVLEVQGLHQLWALKRRMEIPVAHIDRVYSEPSTKLGWWHGLRLPGTHIPGYFVAGTFYQDGKCKFWDVRHPKNTIIIDLVNEGYDQLIVEVENPKDTVKEIQANMTT